MPVPLPLEEERAPSRGRGEWLPCEVEDQRVKRLMLKVIYRAIGDWVFYRESKSPFRRRDAAGAYRWLFLDEGAGGLFSFDAICAVLRQDPARVRDFAKRLTKKSAVVLFRGKASDSGGD